RWRVKIISQPDAMTQEWRPEQVHFPSRHILSDAWPYIPGDALTIKSWLYIVALSLQFCDLIYHYMALKHCRCEKIMTSASTIRYKIYFVAFIANPGKTDCINSK
ncbi:hypothetical protein ACSSQN_023890, partial [Raoultella planticola]|uniref:hypothetical protein n=1 Tax=Raoultella planticola TaxID=575 RepID=UPI003FD6D3A7